MVDINGQFRYITIPAQSLNEEVFINGIGFEASVTVGYVTSNRSEVIRIPTYAKTPNERRFELRNPDATCNLYFC